MYFYFEALNNIINVTKQQTLGDKRRLATVSFSSYKCFCIVFTFLYQW